MRALKILLPLILVLAAVPLVAAIGPWEKNPQSSVRLISPWQVAPVSPADSEIRLGLHFKLAPGWHVYWKNSGDAGFPPVVVFGKTPGMESAELLWPAPERFELRGGLVAFGYADEVVYPIRGKLQPSGADRLRISADVDRQLVAARDNHVVGSGQHQAGGRLAVEIELRQRHPVVTVDRHMPVATRDPRGKREREHRRDAFQYPVQHELQILRTMVQSVLPT